MHLPLRILFVLWLGSTTLAGHAQLLGQPSGGRSAALAGIQSPLADVWSAFGNQAGLAYVDTLALGAYYDKRFQLATIQRSGLVAVLPSRLATVAVAGSFYGFSLYSEALVGVALARELIPRYLALGLKLNYYQLNIADHGQARTATGEIGLLVNPSPRLRIGLRYDNPFAPTIAEYDNEQLPSRLQLGLAYSLGSWLTLLAEADKSFHLPQTNFKFGAELALYQRLYLRTGLGTYPVQQSFGMGLRWRALQVDMAFARHPYLGFSPHVSLLVQP